MLKSFCRYYNLYNKNVFIKRFIPEDHNHFNQNLSRGSSSYTTNQNLKLNDILFGKQTLDNKRLSQNSFNKSFKKPWLKNNYKKFYNNNTYNNNHNRYNKPWNNQNNNKFSNRNTYNKNQNYNKNSKENTYNNKGYYQKGNQNTYNKKPWNQTLNKTTNKNKQIKGGENKEEGFILNIGQEEGYGKRCNMKKLLKRNKKKSAYIY